MNRMLSSAFGGGELRPFAHNVSDHRRTARDTLLWLIKRARPLVRRVGPTTTALGRRRRVAEPIVTHQWRWSDDCEQYEPDAATLLNDFLYQPIRLDNMDGDVYRAKLAKKAAELSAANARLRESELPEDEPAENERPCWWARPGEGGAAAAVSAGGAGGNWLTKTLNDTRCMTSVIERRREMSQWGMAPTLPTGTPWPAGWKGGQ